jgi:5-(carboxyamino)imidazole ribonucleotide synthase
MKKIGILGGGQLGRMLLQAAANYPVKTFVLDNDKNAPAAHLCHCFIEGNITNFEDVYQFGKNVEVLTIEIENVNIEALEKLEQEGVMVIPRPAVLKTIKNKILQKQYYKQHQIPTADFEITNSLSEVKQHTNFLPAVHKIAEGGYDGKGVVILEKVLDINNGFDAPSILEKKINIKKEIAQIIAIGQDGDIALYPPVEMVFDNHLNLLDYQISPANIPEKVLWKVEAISLAVAKNFNSPGLFAVELLIDQNEDVFVNETAPRVHNSGHHTIEAHFSSQFDMLLRILLKYPLGNTDAILPSVMVNIIGSNNYSGKAIYDGLEEVLKIDDCFVHIYGKEQTKPGRKMGHITIMSKEKQELIHQANRIKNTLKVNSTN